MQKENKAPSETHQYVGPYRLEKTLGKGQTGKCHSSTKFYGSSFSLPQSCSFALVGVLFMINEHDK
jgi:hypothetical protein